MGALDDAIRDHLELKRKHGASEEELAAKEREAKQTGALPGEPGETVAAPSPEAPSPSATGPPVTAPTGEPAETASAASGGVDVEEPERALPPVDEAEPDEVLPEEALEMGLPATETPAYDEPGVGPPPTDLIPDDPERNGARSDESLLEETPDFLEDMPEQDRLWFEQKPPKDFDFDD